MRFWDSSALLPLVVEEAGSARLAELMAEDPAAAIWWGTPVEWAGAIARLVRERRADEAGAHAALERLGAVSQGWTEVPPTDRVRTQAQRLLRLHALRAADALQLAAALVLAEHDPRALPFVTLDEQLARAAEREGFAVLG